MIALLFKQISSAASAVGIQEEGVRRMQPDSTVKHTTEHPHSPPGSATECSPQGPARKQVCFNLTEGLGDTPPLPADLAYSLGDATDEWVDASQPPTPWP